MKKLFLLLLPLTLLLGGCSDYTDISTAGVNEKQNITNEQLQKTNILLECILQGDKKCCTYYECK